MRATEISVAVRPGEHACCRFARPDDRARLALSFVRDALARGHQVLYVQATEPAGPGDDITGDDADLAAALVHGDLVVGDPWATPTPEGSADAERVLERIDAAHTAAVVAGYAGLSVTGEMRDFGDVLGGPELAALEHSVGRAAVDATRIVLCLYDHRDAAAVTGAHDVDLSPDLAALARDGTLSAARIVGQGTLRLAGALDYATAPELSDVLGAHFPGPLRLDLADVNFVDVAGMRALRGRTGQPLIIAEASDVVQRLMGLLGWDTDPDVDVAVAVDEL